MEPYGDAGSKRNVLLFGVLLPPSGSECPKFPFNIRDDTTLHPRQQSG